MTVRTTVRDSDRTDCEHCVCAAPYYVEARAHTRGLCWRPCWHSQHSQHSGVQKLLPLAGPRAPRNRAPRPGLDCLAGRIGRGRPPGPPSLAVLVAAAVALALTFASSTALPSTTAHPRARLATAARDSESEATEPFRRESTHRWAAIAPRLPHRPRD